MSKLVTIIRSICGAGKSTLAKQLQELRGGIILCTDDFFLKQTTPSDTEYDFDPRFLGEAHNWNKARFAKAIFDNETHIIVPNTSTEFWEIEPYVKLALKNNYEISIEEPNTPWKFDVEECHKKCIHNVPKETIQKMKDRWETTSSIYDKIEKLAKGE